GGGRAGPGGLRGLQKGTGGWSAFVFWPEGGGKLSPVGFFKLVGGLGRPWHPAISFSPHMLRHACGFHLINEGHSTRRVQDHLGHRNIQHTERYTELCPDRSARLFED